MHEYLCVMDAQAIVFAMTYNISCFETQASTYGPAKNIYYADPSLPKRM